MTPKIPLDSNENITLQELSGLKKIATDVSEEGRMFPNEVDTVRNLNTVGDYGEVTNVRR